MVHKAIPKIIFLAFAVLSLQYCYCQSSFQLGLKAGISVPNLKASGNNPVSKGWASRLGPYGGIVAELELRDRLYLQSELNYSSQGGKKNGIQAISTSGLPGVPIPYVYARFKAEVKLDYIELPVMLKINFPLGDMLSFFINGGPYAGYLLAAKSITSGSSNIYLDENLTQPPLLPQAISFDSTADIKNDIKKFNFGIQGGVGLCVTLSHKNSLMLTGGGNYGLVHLQKDEANGKNNTGAVTVTIAYLINL